MFKTSAVTTLAGKRVLVVEDEAILAMAIEDILEDLGCVVVGPALSSTQGEALAFREALDAAILDINMGKERSFGIADVLRQRSVPFCFATGYGSAGLPSQYAGVPVLAKPYGEAPLGAVLQKLLSPG